MALYRCISTSGSATSLTPSNASPAAITSGVTYEATANGYAISSYSNITPSDAYPLGLNSGDIYKMGGNGYAIESYYDVIPSSASPVTLAEGSFYKVGSNGIAIDAFYTITPSNSSPANLTSGTFFKMAGNGKAIASYSSKTPSDSNPPSVASGDIIKAGGAGYLVNSLPYNFSAPDVVWQGNLSGSATKTIATTSKAKLLLAVRARYGDSGGNNVGIIWDEVKQNGHDWNYTSSGYTHQSRTTQGTFAISDTSVVFTNSSSYTQRCTILIWC